MSRPFEEELGTTPSWFLPAGRGDVTGFLRWVAGELESMWRSAVQGEEAVCLLQASQAIHLALVQLEGRT